MDPFRNAIVLVLKAHAINLSPTLAGASAVECGTWRVSGGGGTWRVSGGGVSAGVRQVSVRMCQ